MRNIERLSHHMNELNGMVEVFKAVRNPQPSTLADVLLIIARYGTMKAVRDCCAASPEHYFPTPQTFLDWMTDPGTLGPFPPVFVEFVTKYATGKLWGEPDAKS
ncbi:hypothetical protein [uncultured Cohaesibacter sp.]|uniref:hypothetical protein n=1 Tax=uncultured Cohaesibacter sp. TaxID=1002546 RepID=UPI0029C6432D|nr:hypothetical protein [uncultured Cohaesibacter sp.]